MKEDQRSALPGITLPSGGGSLKGMGEKFEVNAVTGTNSISVPLVNSPGRSGFGPNLTIAYDSGNGNSSFGMGWNLGIGSISRKTSKRIPNYDDDSDVFLLLGAEDLVRYIKDDGSFDIDHEGNYSIHRYRPRTEGDYSKIEYWKNTVDLTSYWKITSANGVISWYGQTSASRISDPDNESKIYSWLLDKMEDGMGKITLYEYKSENSQGIQNDSFELHRLEKNTFAQKYIKRIKYSNKSSNDDTEFHQQVVFDYGEHSDLTTLEETDEWKIRKDPFSSFRSGFEIRTYRLCERVLIFHDFDSLECVKESAFRYNASDKITTLEGIQNTGYKGEESKSLPEITFDYQKAEIDTSVQTISSEKAANIPSGVDGSEYRWIDLEGEGMPGIVYAHDSNLYYQNNRGNGEFNPIRVLQPSPNMTTEHTSFVDLNQDGTLELVVNDGKLNGYFEKEDEDWATFKHFSSFPNINLNDDKTRMIDLTGDGFPDILLTEETVFTWYESIGKEGYLNAQSASKMLEEDGPAILFSDPEQSIYLADMTGDGLNDITRIRNGEIVYWPNKGYGRFGRKITMKNAPVFDSNDMFLQSNLRLSDIDGTGTTDIIYIRNGEVNYWENYSGNTWGEAIKVNPFPASNNNTTISITDILGKGTGCLVWSSALPHDGSVAIQFVDLAKAGKPFLLKSVNNNMGLEKTFEYAASTQFYLEDLKAGTPWITRLHFPVHVLSMVTSIDHISSSRLSTSYKYHHGYYDGEEREFRGFGMVEVIDSESFDTYNEESELDIEPVLTKTWYHTGAYIQEGVISHQYKSEYFTDDAMTHELSDSSIEMVESMDFQSIREAHRALRGKTLRSELYSLDGTEKESIPYSISEFNYRVEQIQKRGDNLHGVFQCLANEDISYASERNVNDPRIAHSVILEYDEYKNATQTINISYPRRSTTPGVYDEQLELHAVLSTAEFQHETTSYYRLNIPINSKEYHITGLSLDTDAIFYPNDLVLQLEGVLETDVVLEHHESPTTGVEARLLGWTKNEYYGGAIASLVLLKYNESIVASTTHISNVFGSKVDDILMEEAGFRKDSNHWWVKGETVEYLDETGFYLIEKSVDVFGNISGVTYDAYYYSVSKASNALGHEITGETDYRTLSIKKTIDVNGNIAEAITDPLGMVIASTAYGTMDGVDQGDDPIADYAPISAEDIQDILDAPNDYLQGATSFFYYSIEPWQEGHAPPHFIQLTRQTHVKELGPGEESDVQISLGYSDGFGRQLQTKTYMGADEWIVSGRVIYNNKEKPVKQYEPFIVDTPHYQNEEDVAAVGVSPIMYYDPLGRLVKTETPDGFHSKVVIESWKSSKYDANDTVLESKNYSENSHLIGTTSELGKTLEAAIGHADTPIVSHFDSLGREFLTQSVKTSGGTPLFTYMELDIQGNTLSMTDPRLYQNNLDFGTSNRNIETNYDLAGTILKSVSADAGTNYVLNNIVGNVFCAWSARGYFSKTTYNELQKPVETWVEGNGLNHKVSQIVYGTDPAKNNKGRSIVNYDQATRSTIELYDFKGNPVKTSVRLVADYKNTVNWDISVTLESETYNAEMEMDALGKVYRAVQPDGSVHTSEFYHIGWLKSKSVQLREASFGVESTDSATEIIDSIDYNAKGQRTRVVYGNGVQTVYTYNEKTFRLATLKTTRVADSKILQDISYIYDPVGNVIQISDDSHDKVFNAGQVIGPEMEFVYDALYQLSEAKGREHKALTKTDYKSPSTFRDQQFVDINNGADLATYQRYYTYDNGGNLTKMVHSGNNSFTRNFTVDSTSNRSITDEMPGGATIANSFDDAGNMIQLDHLREVNWNYSNQLSSAVIIKRTTANDAEYYTYDTLGQRVRKVHETYDASGNALYTTEKIYLGVVEIRKRYYGNSKTLKDNRSALHVADGTTKIVTAYYWELSEDSHFKENENRIHYQFNNHLGSASLELDRTGQIIGYEEYFPFGGTSFTTGNSDKEVKLKEYRYTGKERDDTTGLYFYGARYYAPWMCRWMKPDPAGMVDGLNLYRYVSNNPINLTDPTGTQERKQLEFWECSVYHQDIRATYSTRGISADLRARHTGVYRMWTGDYTSRIDVGHMDNRPFVLLRSGEVSPAGPQLASENRSQASGERQLAAEARARGEYTRTGNRDLTPEGIASRGQRGEAIPRNPALTERTRELGEMDGPPQVTRTPLVQVPPQTSTRPRLDVPEMNGEQLELPLQPRPRPGGSSTSSGSTPSTPAARPTPRPSTPVSRPSAPAPRPSAPVRPPVSPGVASRVTGRTGSTLAVMAGESLTAEVTITYVGASLSTSGVAGGTTVGGAIMSTAPVTAPALVTGGFVGGLTGTAAEMGASALGADEDQSFYAGIAGAAVGGGAAGAIVGGTVGAPAAGIGAVPGAIIGGVVGAAAGVGSYLVGRLLW